METVKATGVIEQVIQEQLKQLRGKQRRQAAALQKTTDLLLALEKELEVSK